ncbi:DUF1822 family protein [Leptolyngbya sp. NK1-12]|uniref:DUF1822 family protein n=1 Tax=Leptolyngbya sp. NK1-12 TaxID=2547451 RepID=A0AA96WAM4_9CYAN|nr:DUF1822 family protein [Leptolyngbya sp. NK1-12]WNZ21579.1 DUF1822 family protein [Leptolyngbya sp. NK1-12]
MMNASTEDFAISIPITPADRQQARKLAQHFAKTRAERIYRNTLAILVVHYYLQMLGVSTDLQASYSWDPTSHVIADLADLYVPATRRRLECRSVRAGERTCFIPEEVWDDRIGYVVVQLDDAGTEGTILGFASEVSVEYLPLSELQSLDALIDCIAEYSGVPAEPAANVLPEDPVTVLSDWFQGAVESIWQTLEELPLADAAPVGAGARFLDTPQAEKKEEEQTKEQLIQILQTTEDEEERWLAAEQLRQLEPNHSASGVWKALDLSLQLPKQSIALMVAVLPKPNQSVAVLLRVYPVGNQAYLPEGLKLVGLDEHEATLFEVEAKNNPQTGEKPRWIQFKFCSDLNDRFDVKLIFNNARITESFII